MSSRRSHFGRIVKRRKPDGRVVGLSYRKKCFPGFYVRVRRAGRSVDIKAGSTVAEAREVLAKLQREVFEQSVLGVEHVEPVRFNTFADAYLDYAAKVQRESTVTDARAKVKSVLKPTFGHQLVHEITKRDVEKFLEERAGVVKVATMNRDMSLLSSIMKRAIRLGHASVNPCAGVQRHKEELKPIPRLTIKQQQALVDACPSWIRPIVILAIDTGARRSELLNLTWPDVRLDRGVVVFRRTKTGKPREVPLTPRAAALLRELQADRVKPLEGPDRVFSWRAARWGGTDTKAFTAAAEAVGARDLTFHGLRHNCACNLLDAGATLAEVRDILGHESLSTALRYSRHVEAVSVRAAIARLGELTGGTAKRMEGTS